MSRLAQQSARPRAPPGPFVGGQSLLQVRTVRGTENQEYPGIVDADEFERRFLLYHSLLFSFESRIRRKAKQRYLRAVSQLLSRQVEASFERQKRDAQKFPEEAKQGYSVTEGPITLSVEDSVTLAEASLSLCRLYPFKPILFAPRGAAERYAWNGVTLGDGYNFDCGIAGDNPYFDRTPLREFLSLEKVSTKMREGLNSEVGRCEMLRRNIGMREHIMSNPARANDSSIYYNVFEDLESKVAPQITTFFVPRDRNEASKESQPSITTSAVPVRDDPELRKVAAENQWKRRGEQGFARRTAISDFLLTVYGPWIQKGMNQSDLLALDRNAWYALRNFLRHKNLPFHFPTKKAAYLEAITDPVTRNELLKAREFNRNRMRILNRIRGDLPPEKDRQ